MTDPCAPSLILYVSDRDEAAVTDTTTPSPAILATRPWEDVDAWAAAVTEGAIALCNRHMDRFVRHMLLRDVSIVVVACIHAHGVRHTSADDLPDPARSALLATLTAKGAAVVCRRRCFHGRCNGDGSLW